MTTEVWKDVLGYIGLYRVSDMGRVLSQRIVRRKELKAKILAVRYNQDGYISVVLYKNGVTHSKMVHRLVLEAFVGPCPEGMQCRHLDGNPANNRLENICWGTPEENAKDRNRHGHGHKETCRRGENIAWSKFTEDDIRRIRKLYADKVKSQGQLAKEYGVYQSYISRIVRKIVWSHVN